MSMVWKSTPLIPVLSLMLAAACSPAQPTYDEPQASDSAIPPPAPDASAIHPESSAPAERAKLSLGSNGMFLRIPGAGRQEGFAFGAPRKEVEAAATISTGQPPKRSQNGECGEGPLQFTQYGPLQLAFQEDKFQGWLLESGLEIATVDGVMPGISEAQLASERQVSRAKESTLDNEFSYVSGDGETIGGFFDGPGRNARVKSLYAGMTCFFR